MVDRNWFIWKNIYRFEALFVFKFDIIGFSLKLDFLLYLINSNWINVGIDRFKLITYCPKLLSFNKPTIKNQVQMLLKCMKKVV